MGEQIKLCDKCGYIFSEYDCWDRIRKIWVCSVCGIEEEYSVKEVSDKEYSDILSKEALTPLQRWVIQFG